jgi:hypothetical protein
MAHKWKRLWNKPQPTRVCEYCKKEQKLELVNYDVMSGSKYRWLPLAGSCIKRKRQND